MRCSWWVSDDVSCMPYRKNEVNLRWVAEETWTFQRSFDLPESIGQYRLLNMELVFDGVDTIAAIHLNDTFVRATKNAQRCSLEPSCIRCHVYS